MTSRVVSACTLTLDRPVTGRLPVLDELKGLAIILVLLYHAGGALLWQNLLHGDLGVDIFVILSGVGLVLGSGADAPAGTFLKRRLRRILPTYWILLTAYLVLNSHYLQHRYTGFNITVHYLGIHAWFGDGYAMSINDSFWFITLILSLYVVFLGVRRWLDQPEKLLLAGAVITVIPTLLWFWKGQAGSFGHLGLRIPGFFVGLLLGQLLRTGRVRFTLGGALAAAAFILVYLPYTQGVVFHTVVGGAVLMLAYARGLVPHLADPKGLKVRGFLAFLGERSLEIFLIHQPLIRDYNYYLHGRWFGIGQPTPGTIAIGIAIGFAVTLLAADWLHRLLRRLLPA